MHGRRLLLATLLGTTVSAVGCTQTANLIPGHGTAGIARISPAPAPITAPPLLAPGALRLAGSAGAGENRQSIPEADLARTLFSVQAVDGEGASANLVRGGQGVLIDRQQQLVLTSWQLVQPTKADASPAYVRLLAGPASEGGGRPEFIAVIVAADPRADAAVLRLTTLREGAAQPTGEWREAVPADSSSLRRGDRVRMLVQPSPERSQPIQVTMASVTGFAADGSEPRAWLKTDARASATALGAPVFDQSGLLVGFGTQLILDANAPVSLVRPLARAIETITQAKAAAPNAQSRPLLQFRPSISGTATVASDGVVVSRPVFAESAVEGPGFRDLFDYKTAFRPDIAELNYEFATQGIPKGALVQELWYLNGVLQDALSSSYAWDQGAFAIVSDRMTRSNARSIPNGRWTMEVWVAGTVRATSTVAVGVPEPTSVASKPAVDGFRFAASAAPDQQPGARPTPTAKQLLAFFNYRQAATAKTIRWVAIRDGRTMLQTTTQPWLGGSQGSWWVGTSDPAGVGAGTWEFQIYFDDALAASGRIEVR